MSEVEHEALGRVIAILADQKTASRVLSQGVCDALGRHRQHVTDNISLAVLMVPAGFEWLVRSDEDRGGFANVTPSFGVPVLGARGATLDFGFKSYGATPCLALCRAICKTHFALFEGEPQRTLRVV